MEASGRRKWIRGRRLLAAVSMLAAVDTVALAQWGTTQTIGTGADPFAVAPRVALDAGGAPTVAFAALTTIFAVSGTNTGTWSQAVELGTFDAAAGDSVALAVSSESGKALVAWFDGGAIRSATRPAGDIWTVPGGAGGNGTATLPDSTHVSLILAAIDSNGMGVIAWEAQGQQSTVQLLYESGAAGWVGPETLPITQLGHAALARGDDGSVVLLSDAQGVQSVRRDPVSGSYTVTGAGAGVSVRLERMLGDAAGDTVAAAVYAGATIRIARTSISAASVGQAAIYSENATRPTLQLASNAAGIGARVASGDVTAAWLTANQNTRELRAATQFGAAVTVATLPAGLPTSVAAARTSGDDSVVVYTDASNAQPGVRAFTRTPCASGAWDTSVGLDASSNYGAVNAAAGGNVAVGVWVSVLGEVRAALFSGTPIPAGGLCPARQCSAAAGIPNFDDASMTLLDVDAGTTLRTLPVGKGPYGVAVHPVDDSIWITNRDAGTVSVLSDSATLATIAVGKNPLGIAFDAAGTQAFVANYDPDTVSIIDTATRTVVGTVAVGAGPLGIAVGAAGRVWTANYAANTISLIDTTVVPPTVFTTRPITFRPFAIAESPDGKSVLVSGYRTNRVVVLDLARRRVVKRIRVGRRPRGIVFAPAPATRAFVANAGSRSVTVIDTASNAVLGRIPTAAQPFGVSIDPTGQFLYVVEAGANKVLKWDLGASRPVGQFNVGRLPVGLGNFVLRHPVCTAP